MPQTDSQTKSRCPLTSDTQKRATANRQMKTINAAFPAGVSQPALRALLAEGYTHLDQLANLSVKDLRALHGMGPKVLGVLQAALEAKGKSLLW